MKIGMLVLTPYEMPLITGQVRAGVLLNITDEKGNTAAGDVAPLPLWSRETLDEALEELKQKKEAILKIDWTANNIFKELTALHLLPSLSFGLESALLSLLSPLPKYSPQTSALLMGSYEEILERAFPRKQEGYTSAKLKVGHLSFKEASDLINQLKDTFHLRIDVNRAWKTKDSLDFFSEFPLDAFDYVEEPFQNPHDLKLFTHPLAVDESFPSDLTLKDLENLPTLKALIYKPTIQGGMLHCLPIQKWANKKNISLVLSSSFESKTGLAHITSIAQRLSLNAPIGIGTSDYIRT